MIDASRMCLTSRQADGVDNESIGLKGYKTKYNGTNK
jgi:hypothetical protein